MKHKILITFLTFIFSCVSFAFAFDLMLKLPYENGESFILTQGYNTSFTHNGKDKYALDFALSGNKGYGKSILAVADGKVKLVAPDTKTGKDYGNHVKIDHGNGIESIYAHLSGFAVDIKKGESIKQGEIVGYMGNSGFCRGNSSLAHPGTHLHFALYKKENGKYIGVKPESMSGYVKFATGNKYTSDNKVFVKGDEEEGEKLAREENKFQENNEKNKNNKSDQTDQNQNTKSGFWNSAGNFVKGFTDNAVNSFMSVPKAIKNIGEGAGHKIVKTVNKGKNIVFGGKEKIASILDFPNPLPEGKEKPTPNPSQEGNNEKSFEEKYNAKLIAQAAFGVSDKFSKIISLNPGQEITLSAQYKNTGSESWSKNNTSINYVGFQTREFYHPGWLTLKRPSRLDQNITKENEAGGFTFPIKASETAGLYTFSVRPVIFVDGNYEWLGDDAASWNIAVAPKIAILEEIPLIPFFEKGGVNKENEKGEVKGASDIKNGKADNSEENKKEKEEETKSQNTRRSSSGSNSASTSISSSPPSTENETDEEEVEGVSDENTENEENSEDSSSEKKYEIPDTTLEKYPLELTNENFAEFSFSSNISEATFKCSLNNEEFADCESPINYENLEDGGYKFEVKSINNGVEDPTPAEYIWTVDIIAPNKIDDLEASSVENGKANLSWTLPDDEISEINLYYSKTGECSPEFMLSEDLKTIKIILSETGGDQSALEIINLERGKNYCFAITTTDSAGNISEISNIAGATISSQADHIVISEIQFAGSTANDEFIELYNPTDEDMDLENYSIQYLGSAADQIKKKNFEGGNKIESHGFFLITHNDWSGIKSDMDHATFNLSYIGGTVYLVKSKNYIKENGGEINYDDVVDYVSYTKEFGGDGSIERKANQYSTSESMLEVPDKYGGNAFDSDDDIFDFIVRETSDPQNTASLKEPHQNQPPKVEITSPENNAVYLEGEIISFSAEVSDLEDGLIGDKNIIWEEGDLEIGEGSEIEIDNLLQGDHNITLEITDSDREITTEEINVKIISDKWSEPVKISGAADNSEFSVDIDEGGNVYVIYMTNNDDGSVTRHIYRKIAGDTLNSPPKEIFRSQAHRLTGASNLSFKVDSENNIHVIFQAYSLEDGSYNVYYSNLTNNFSGSSAPRKIISDGYNSQLVVGGVTVHIIATDGVNKIFHRSSVEFSNFRQWTSNKPYEISDIHMISELSAVADVEGNLHIAFLAKEKSSSATLVSKNKKILPYMMMPEDFSIFYLNRNFVDASWNIKKIDEGYSNEAMPEINIIESQPVIVVNDNGDNLRLFLKNGDGVWDNTLIEPELLVDMEFSSGVDPQNYVHVVSTDYYNSENLQWTTNFPNGNYKTFPIESVQEKFSAIYTLELSIGDSGKAGVVFNGREAGSNNDNIYYIEKELY